jgi:hypothetical protein
MDVSLSRNREAASEASRTSIGRGLERTRYQQVNGETASRAQYALPMQQSHSGHPAASPRFRVGWGDSPPRTVPGCATINRLAGVLHLIRPNRMAVE